MQPQLQVSTNKYQLKQTHLKQIWFVKNVVNRQVKPWNWIQRLYYGVTNLNEQITNTYNNNNHKSPRYHFHNGNATPSKYEI